MYTVETIIDVRYYETDLMGIVHHSNYIRYFECGRSDALIKIGLPINKIEEEGIMLPVVSANLKYKLPAKYGDTLRIVSTVSELPKVKIVVDTIIYNQEDRVLCTGSITLGFIHADSRKPTRAPKSFVDKFAPFFKEIE